jgi:hypothetical protein
MEKNEYNCTIEAMDRCPCDSQNLNITKIGYYHHKWSLIIGIQSPIHSYNAVKEELKALGYNVINTYFDDDGNYHCEVRREIWMTNINIKLSNDDTAPWIIYSLDERRYSSGFNLSEDIKQSLEGDFYINPVHILCKTGIYSYVFVSGIYKSILCNIHSHGIISIPIDIIQDFSPRYHINISFMLRQLKNMGYSVDKKRFKFSGNAVDVYLLTN